MSIHVATIALRREPGHLTRSLTALLLRVALGLIFLLGGINKFDPNTMAPKTQYVEGMVKQFEKTRLKTEMVRLFTNVLPYAEVGVGSALILGLLTPLTAALSGILLLHLLFGQIHLGNPSTIPAMLTYVLVNAGILWLSPVTSNYLSIDGLFFGWFWKPKGEGEFRREEVVETKLKKI